MTHFAEKFSEADRSAFVACAIELGNVAEARRRAASGNIDGLSGPMEISQGYASELVAKRRREIEEAGAAEHDGRSAADIAQSIVDRELARMAAASKAGTLDFAKAREMARALAELDKLAGRMTIASPPRPAGTVPESPRAETIIERLTREAQKERDAEDAAESTADEDIIYDDDPRFLNGDDARLALERNLAALQNGQ